MCCDILQILFILSQNSNEILHNLRDATCRV